MSIRRIHALFRVAPAATAFLLATAACAGDLAGDVRAKLKASQLNEANIGYMVIDVATGKTVASHNETIARMPASNMKVLTTAAALRVLGADYCYATRLVRSGDRLTVIGDGDPSLGDPEMADVNTVTDETGTRRSGLGTEAMVDLWVSAANSVWLCALDTTLCTQVAGNGTACSSTGAADPAAACSRSTFCVTSARPPSGACSAASARCADPGAAAEKAGQPRKERAQKRARAAGEERKAACCRGVCGGRPGDR